MIYSPARAVAKVPFTALVVTLNERRHLRECLHSLAGCSQIVVIDLGSSDGSIDIALESGAEVIHHKRVPIVEQVRKDSIAYARNDWIIFLDPDEIFPTAAMQDILSAITATPRLGMISLPWQFYFKGKPLHCTIWGRENQKPVLIHKERIAFSGAVHRGISILPSYISLAFPREDRYVIRHYWVESYTELFEKHLRYIRQEGFARFCHGQRFSLFKLIKDPLSALKNNLCHYHGLRGGILGVFLSVFYAFYIFLSLCSLWKYERDLQSIPSDDCKS
jgi:glycosyltransferase involved in cell wall biosynthesis